MQKKEMNPNEKKKKIVPELFNQYIGKELFEPSKIVKFPPTFINKMRLKIGNIWYDHLHQG